MINNKVSVVVPVYNDEGTIEACIESIVNNYYQDLEIIVVNDGSSDKSSDICKRLAKKDSRIIVIDKNNGGVSSARNMGIDLATGEYLCFVDSDDEVSRDYIGKFVEEIEEQIDLVVGGAVIYSIKDTKQMFCGKNVLVLEQMTYQEFLELFDLWLMAPAWGKLFRTNIVKKNHVYFDKTLTCGEDHLFVFEYLKMCSQIKFIDKCTYFYYTFRSSGGKRVFPLEGQIKIYESKVSVFKKYYKDTDIIKQYCARAALHNFKARVRYWRKKKLKDKSEWEEAYVFYWQFICPYLEVEQSFEPDDWEWLIQNKQYLINGNMKKLYINEVRKNNTKWKKRIGRKYYRIKEILKE